MVKRLVVYGLLAICATWVFTAETPSTQREEKEITIVFGKVSYTPYQDEYEKLLYPTVRITTGFATGSGVIFETTDSHRLTQIFILTACHVVDKENIVNIELYNSTIITGTVVITDTVKDLALIKSEINTDSKIKIYTAQLADKNYTPYLFCPVWAVGCSLGLKPRPSFGHLTKVHEFSSSRVHGSTNELMNSRTCELFWEISAPILPGNSGGPVYDAHTYEVIGIAVWVKVYQYQLVTTMAGIVPINQIYEFLQPQITQINTDKHK